MPNTFNTKPVLRVDGGKCSSFFLMKSDLFYFRGTLLLEMSSGDQSSRGPLGGESCYYIPGALYTRCIIY